MRITIDKHGKTNVSLTKREAGTLLEAERIVRLLATNAQDGAAAFALEGFGELVSCYCGPEEVASE